MIKTMKQYVIVLSVFTFIFVFVILAGTLRVEYNLIAPGFNDEVSSFISVPSDYESEGSFHTTSVISLDGITVMQKLFGENMKTVTVREFPEYYRNIVISDLRVMGSLSKNDSLQTSLIVAANASETPIEYISYPTVYLTYTHLTEDTLEIGDFILEVNESTDVYTEFAAVACEETTTVKILRDEEELTFDITRNPVDDICTFGIYVKPLSEIITLDLDYELLDTNTGGPSGGFIQSLFIFNQLTEFDYTNGYKIAGTGTVNAAGEIGYIGGVRQKIITAISNEIDIFFIPHLNDTEFDDYIEALAVLEEFNTDMIVVGVSDFSEAITYLEGLGE